MRAGWSASGGMVAVATTEALRTRSLSRLLEGFTAYVAKAGGRHPFDYREQLMSFAPFVDCCRRLGADPLEALGPAADAGAAGYGALFRGFAAHESSLGAFGWHLLEDPEGPEYRFAWPVWKPPTRSTRPVSSPDDD